MKKIPKGQALELIAKLEAAGLNRDLAQAVIAATDNSLAKKMVDAITSKTEQISVFQENLVTSFQKISEFKIVIPKSNSFNLFKEENVKAFSSIDKDINDANFKPSFKPNPGETRMVSIYRVVKKVKLVNCLAFAKHQGILPNAQGLAYIWLQNREAMPAKLCLLGLDNPDNLLKIGEHQALVPILVHNSFGYIFDLIAINEEVATGYCVVVFN